RVSTWDPVLRSITSGAKRGAPRVQGSNGRNAERDDERRTRRGIGDMSGAFHIRRIRLINFHNFVDETLRVRKNLFLIGDNQCGKTTVLDAVHFALSAGVEMEFNAASRFGPRSEPGRNLASIVLRYDLERDVAMRGPSVMY